MHITDEKSALRGAIKERIERMPPHLRDMEERSLMKRIQEFLGDVPRTIAAFVPVSDEVNIKPLLMELLKNKWTLFLPAFEGGKLAFRKAEDLDHLVKGFFGIPEPSPSHPLLNPKHLDIALVPGRAFTKDGHRLGRGNGGYDMWIRDQRMHGTRAQFVGIGLECQVVKAIPLEPHDQKLDMILTARGDQSNR